MLSPEDDVAALLLARADEDIWRSRFEEDLEQASFTASELTELARRQRAAAHVTDSPGQRRGLLSVAKRFERAAAERAIAQP